MSSNQQQNKSSSPHTEAGQSCSTSIPNTQTPAPLRPHRIPAPGRNPFTGTPVAPLIIRPHATSSGVVGPRDNRGGRNATPVAPIAPLFHPLPPTRSTPQPVLQNRSLGNNTNSALMASQDFPSVPAQPLSRDGGETTATYYPSTPPFRPMSPRSIASMSFESQYSYPAYGGGNPRPLQQRPQNQLQQQQQQFPQPSTQGPRFLSTNSSRPLSATPALVQEYSAPTSPVLSSKVPFAEQADKLTTSFPGVSVQERTHGVGSALTPLFPPHNSLLQPVAPPSIGSPQRQLFNTGPRPPPAANLERHPSSQPKWLPTLSHRQPHHPSSPYHPSSPNHPFSPRHSPFDYINSYIPSSINSRLHHPLSSSDINLHHPRDSSARPLPPLTPIIPFGNLSAKRKDIFGPLTMAEAQKGNVCRGASQPELGALPDDRRGSKRKRSASPSSATELNQTKRVLESTHQRASLLTDTSTAEGLTPQAKEASVGPEKWKAKASYENLVFSYEGKELIRYADPFRVARDGRPPLDLLLQNCKGDWKALVGLNVVPEVVVETKDFYAAFLYRTPGVEYSGLHDVLKDLPPPAHRGPGENTGEIHYVDRFDHNAVMVMVDTVTLEGGETLRRINSDGTAAEGAFFYSGGAIWGPRQGSPAGARPCQAFPLLLADSPHTALLKAIRGALLPKPWKDLGYRRVVIIHWSMRLSQAMADKQFGRRFGGWEGMLVEDLWEMVNSIKELYQVEVQFLEGNNRGVEGKWVMEVARNGNLPVEVTKGDVTIRSDEEIEWEGRKWEWKGGKTGWVEELRE
ncbi:hypothetical protein TWF506_002066 [Arthrobotrys conoides]|uniref:Uncharacterized protein n=1 Tax=Arthrobotrys conoides TaxID=74498 RepID=A0AAN8NNX8_9PEZI